MTKELSASVTVVVKLRNGRSESRGSSRAAGGEINKWSFTYVVVKLRNGRSEIRGSSRTAGEEKLRNGALLPRKDRG